MKMPLFIVALLLISMNSVAAEDSFKSSTLRGYEKRCKEALTSKGYLEVVVEKECSCEVAVIDRNFSTFNLIVMGAKSAAGKDMISREKMEEIKKKMQMCRKRYLK